MANIMTKRQEEIVEAIANQMIGEMAEMYHNVPDSIADATDEGTFTVAVNVTVDAP